MILATRNKLIDFLRGIAVLLVVFFHYPTFKILNKMGWVGVDLFFVLSGFLVSGLLFREYNKQGSVNISRFLIRRGFKIYPLFYFFILVTFGMRLFHNEALTLKESLGELLFIRNYIGGYWIHTWSLSVEEQFYFFLAVLAFLAVKNNWLNRHTKVLLFFGVEAMLCLMMRILTVAGEHTFGRNTFFNDWALHVHTHLRIDSLLFGVFIAWQYNCNQQQFLAFAKRLNNWLLLIFAVCITPVFLLPISNPFIATVGFTLLYIGFGALLVYCITKANVELNIARIVSPVLFNIISNIGVYSYAVYLWHFFVRYYIMQFYIEPLNWPHIIEVVVYIGLSLLLSIFLSKKIEYYFLKIRDKYFP